MNEQLQPEQNVMVCLKKIQQQLAVLETKVDTLINQSSSKPFSGKSFRENKFSKPFRSFNPHRQFNKERGNFSSGEKGCGKESREFGQHRKNYDNPSEGNSGHGHHFKKRYGGQSRGFDQKSKPFYFLERKERR